MENNNLRIWEQVQETDQEHTAKSNFDGRTVTSINGTYIVKRATEIFGPLGHGWGYEIEEESFTKGAPAQRDGQDLGHEIMHTLRVQLWYMLDGERCTITHYGHTPYVRMTLSYGLKTDFDAPKKSLTDAIKKCLSMLGFSADVFLGLYDNDDYVETVTAKQQARNADEQEERILQERKEFSQWIREQIELFQHIPKAGALKVTYNKAHSKASRQAKLLNMELGPIHDALRDAYQKRLDELSPDVDLVCESCGTIGKGKPGRKCPECGSEKRSPAGKQG